MQRLFALLLLATALLKTFLTWPWRRRRALRGFRERYAPDGLVPNTAAVHRLLTQPSHCTGCRRCDHVRPGEGARSELLEPSGCAPEALSYLVQAALRSLPDADLAVSGFGAYTEADLRLAENLCPYGVPLRQLAELARLAARHAGTEVAPLAPGRTSEPRPPGLPADASANQSANQA